MSQINVTGLTFCYDGSYDNIFEDVSFSIDTNWRLGFIGRNGKGKTTFLRLLLGEHAYHGTISTNAKFEYFPYRIPEEMLTLCADEMIGTLKPDRENWRVICELSLLGEDAEVLYRPFTTLSHGQRTKILLAVLFAGENEFLLIDEPTNHLDAGARDKVKSYLAGKNGFILVSHDRDLLDACTDHVLVLNRQSIEVQTGNFSSWWENKQRADKFAEAEDDKRRREIKKLKAAAQRTAEWADKSERSKIGYDPVKENDRSISARSFIGAKTKKMQSRVAGIKKRIDREIEEKEGLLNDIESVRELRLTQLTHHSKVLVNVRELCFSYPGKQVLDGLTFTVEQGDRIALSGDNGCGKSTVIKRILTAAGADALPEHSESGICECASGLIISYADQDTSRVTGTIPAFCDARGIDRSLFCTILRHLGLEREQFDKDLSDHSEGQKKKALLAASLCTPAHLYIWDEPLNFIDVFSRMQLERLISEYKPTMLFVEHDVRFRETVANRTINL